MPGCPIREWGEGEALELFRFLRCCELLAFGAFALAAERSNLSDYLAAVVSETSELLPRPAGAEEKSNLRGRGETPVGGP